VGARRPTRSQLAQGLDRADSSAADAHKWLNVTYDCGDRVRARSVRTAAHVRRPRRRTTALIAAVQDDGRTWCGPTQWNGETAMRISMSSWKTDLADAALAADVILELAGALADSRIGLRRTARRSTLPT
jgi:glutamate/tyrosine decarboxylase-like PLP-dependent enzyme